MSDFLDYFTKPEVSKKLDQQMNAVIKEYKKEYDKYKKIPENKYINLRLYIKMRRFLFIILF